ncbi:hypothetical protein ACGFX4_21475 [Kitasatospora sp. NPDC048365]|uniref:hypothetical protein n=1 Tax=Kitasatospora sp. NPDC048365 TaxID=3364050 RepID=UPI00371A5AD7
MRVLAYELRRLRGLRSTWLILGAVLLADAAVAAVLARQLPDGELSVAAAVRCVAAVVPLLPLPVAALGAGALGALSYGHEVRFPGLAASRVSFGRRIGLVGGKLAVIGAVSALLAVVSLAVDAVVVRFAALPGGVDGSAVFDGLAAFRPGAGAAVAEGAAGSAVGGTTVATDGTAGSLLAEGSAGRPLLAFVVMVVLGGCAGLLLTSVVRSAAAGLLALCALPALLEPTAGLVLRQGGLDWPVWARELMPFQYGLDWVRGAPGAVAAAGPEPLLLAALLAPVVVLLAAGVLVQFRRRAL